MYYEINVSQYGQHVFATAPRSLTEDYRAHELYNIFCEKFPVSDGYVVTVTRWETVGKHICSSRD
jgi:hypothetical protein